MLNERNVEEYFDIHNEIIEKIHEIVGYHGDINDQKYVVLDYEVIESGDIAVSLEHLKWNMGYQDGIIIERRIFYKDSIMNELRVKAEKAKQERNTQKKGMELEQKRHLMIQAKNEYERLKKEIEGQ